MLAVRFEVLGEVLGVRAVRKLRSVILLLLFSFFQFSFSEFCFNTVECHWELVGLLPTLDESIPTCHLVFPIPFS